jgi:glycerol-3-phosphate O-acyltransferase 3/4
MNSIVKGNFSECFAPKPPPAWNFNLFLFVLWGIGVIIRYFILLPLRIIWFILGSTVFLGFYFTFFFLPESGKWRDWRTMLIRKSLQYYGALVWMISLNCVIQYHGTPPVRRKNQIYVANHSSLIDFIILLSHNVFGTVGQKHTGLVGVLQDKLIAPLQNIWFERSEVRDRKIVSERMTQHINDLSNPPLLIFPEGVCVNNEYCVMFKQGAFQLGAEVCPIAIRYNKMFSDPYWSSRDESFVTHVLRLMKSWCLVVDVWFLEPQLQASNESPIEFANRVKKMICKYAVLIDVPYDGMMKYYVPSEKLKVEKQKMFADKLKKIEK